MGVAIRDYIPDGDATPTEVARMRRGAIIRTGANHQDFIPDPNDPSVPVVKRTQEERADRAAEFAQARIRYAERNEFQLARMRLKEWTPVQAVTAIEVMPVASLEMYLAAEMLGAARTDIVKMFPPIDPKVVERYAAQLEAQEAAEVEDVQATKAVDPEPEPLHVEAVVEPEEQTVDETFLCIDCGKVCQNLTGLQAHIRAKHP